MMYIWLKKGIEEQLELLKEKGVLGKKLQVKTERDTGKNYLEVYFELDPLPDVIPEEIVERVTMVDYIYNSRAFRPEGIYRHKGAELVICNKEEDWLFRGISGVSH